MGSVQHYPTHADAGWRPININSAGTTSFGGNPNEYVRVYGLVLCVNSGTSVTIQLACDSGATILSGAMALSQGVPLVLDLVDKPFVNKVTNGSFQIIVAGTSPVITGLILYNEQ